MKLQKEAGQERFLTNIRNNITPFYHPEPRPKPSNFILNSFQDQGQRLQGLLHAETSLH